jgi:hypothetical protein
VWALLTAAAVAVPAGWLAAYLITVTLLFTAAELLHAPVSNAFAAEAAPEQARGAYLAAFQYGFALAGVVTPAAFTVLFSTAAALPWILVAVIATAGTAAVPLLARLPGSGTAAAPKTETAPTNPSAP